MMSLQRTAPEAPVMMSLQRTAPEAPVIGAAA